LGPITSDGVSRLGLGLETSLGLGLERLRSRLGLERFRSRVLGLEVLGLK